MFAILVALKISRKFIVDFIEQGQEYPDLDFFKKRSAKEGLKKYPITTYIPKQ